MTVPLVGCIPRIAGGEGNHWVVCNAHGWDHGPHHHRRGAVEARREHRNHWKPKNHGKGES